MGVRSNRDRKAGFDPIAFVESAYDLASSEAEWLEALCVALQARLPPRRTALVGYVLDMEALAARTVVVAEGAPQHIEVTQAVCRVPAVRRCLSTTQVFSAGHSLGPSFQSLLARCPPELARYTAGIADFVGLTSNTEADEAIVIGAPVGSAERGLSPRLSPSLLHHLATAGRLRRRLRQPALGEPVAEAILDVRGRVLHAVGAASARDSLERLRAAAQGMDRARTRAQQRDPDGALELWQGLVEGRWTVLDRIDSDGKRLFIAFCNSGSADPRALTPGERAVLQLAVEGSSGKQVAAALQLSPSTVSQRLASARRKLGAQKGCDPFELYARRPTLDRFPLTWPELRTARGSKGPLETFVLSVELAPGELPSLLTPAERELVRLLLAGRSRQSVARLRGVSPHTIHHQITSIYRKLGISSRRELALKLLAEPGDAETNAD